MPGRKTGFGIVLTAALTSAACATVSAADLSNAVLSPTTPQARSELSAIIQSATGNKTLTLSEISLTAKPTLPIVRATQRPEIGAPPGQGFDGRMTDMPRVFTLKTNGEKCWLYDSETKTLHALKSVNCRAV